MMQLIIGVAVVWGLFVIVIYRVKRITDPYSAAITCVPVMTIPVLFFSMLGARAIINAFREMATTGQGGVGGIVSVLESVNRVYVGVDAVSAFVFGIVGVVAVMALMRPETTKPSSRLRSAVGVGVSTVAVAAALTVSILETRNIVYPLAVFTIGTERDSARMTMTLEAAKALHVENTEMATLSGHIARNLLLQAVVAFIAVPVCVVGFAAILLLGIRSAVTRSSAGVGLALAVAAALIFGVQTYRHLALGGELSYAAGNGDSHREGNGNS